MSVARDSPIPPQSTCRAAPHAHAQALTQVAVPPAAQRVVELHNAGKLPGFIAVGARVAWLAEAPLVYPTLAVIRDTNLESLKKDTEVKCLYSDIELEIGGEEAAVRAPPMPALAASTCHIVPAYPMPLSGDG